MSKRITELPAATSVQPSDLFVIARPPSNYRISGDVIAGVLGGGFGIVPLIVETDTTLSIPANHGLVAPSPYTVDGTLIVDGIMVFL
ncbi:MAG: hypothetical protein HC911_18025 [Chloroflexaceae bacterium]|nr:hypothetical protein [Chloroflexaceae bacterium]